MNIRRVVCCLVAVVSVAVLAPAAAFAQSAWIPGKGESHLAFQYQYVSAGDHLFSGPIEPYGSAIDLGKVQSQVMVLHLDVGITDKLAVSGSIAFISAKYTEGGVPLFGPGVPNAEDPVVDNGDWQSAFQDGRIAARYAAFDNGTWALTPQISYGFPANDYITFGHVAQGKDINELQVGLNWGRILSSSDTPFGYLFGTVAYSFMEDAEDFPLSRTDVLVGFGYFLKHLDLNLYTNYQNIHGGLDWYRDLGDDATEGHFMDHDRAAAEDFWRVGVGVIVPVSLSFKTYADISTTLWGVNTHEALAFQAGMLWDFRLFGGTDWWDDHDEG